MYQLQLGTLWQCQGRGWTKSFTESRVPVHSQVPYRLHAVLVHQGQANAGHYWAFIYDQPRKSWLKYNDISVTESSWEELERDSFGGLKNASAYCLMYISDKVSRLPAGTRARLPVHQLSVCDRVPRPSGLRHCRTA